MTTAVNNAQVTSINRHEVGLETERPAGAHWAVVANLST